MFFYKHEFEFRNTTWLPVNEITNESPTGGSRRAAQGCKRDDLLLVEDLFEFAYHFLGPGVDGVHGAVDFGFCQLGFGVDF
jgi:hypothetical protein